MVHTCERRLLQWWWGPVGPKFVFDQIAALVPEIMNGYVCITVTWKGEVVPCLEGMCGNRGTVLHILELRLMNVFSFILWPHYPSGRICWCLVDMRLNGLQSQSKLCRREKSLMSIRNWSLILWSSSLQSSHHTKLNSVASVSEQTIPTEWLILVSVVSANLCV
jgi:hypothetical protein